MSILLIIAFLIIVVVCCALLSGGSNSNNSNNETTYVYTGGKKRCPNCGREINEIAVNCGFCGYCFSSGTKPHETYTNTIGKKRCPNCGREISEIAVNCGFCGYSFNSGTATGGNRMNTRHINKNGLSFDCPDYYDIGSYPSSDEFHKSIVALSKNDRTCELYVMEYKPIHFDNNARMNSSLLKEYLKMQGYTNITENRSLPYCFNARINSGVGMLNTKIVYNFDYQDVIMIVGNTVPGSTYNCINDMKVINDTVRPI